MKTQANLHTIDKNYRYKLVTIPDNEASMYLLDVEYRIRGCFLYRLNWRTTQKLYKITLEQLEQITDNISSDMMQKTHPVIYVGIVIGGPLMTATLKNLNDTYKLSIPEFWRYVVVVMVMLLGFLVRLLFANSRKKKLERYIALSELDMIEAKVTPTLLHRKRGEFLRTQIVGWLFILLLGPLLYIGSNNWIGLLGIILGIVLTFLNRLAFIDGLYMMEIVEPTKQ